MKNKIICGDSLEVLKDFEDNYFDSVVTDPPYGLSFMGKSWDYDVPQIELWKEVYRVIKPGGYILSFAGSRTYHRMAVNIEDAGFEIRDMLGWLYGSGFPKSHNIGKAVDKIQGNKREEILKVDINHLERGDSNIYNQNYTKDYTYFNFENEPRKKRNSITTKGNSEWEGWGTALKPAHEPIVMARKPFNTSVAENVLTHGTGGINIDECRVGTNGGTKKINTENCRESLGKYGDGLNGGKVQSLNEGRFPANIIHDGSEEVLEVFEESSRFFYCAKASKAERNMGLDNLAWEKENFETKKAGGMSGRNDGSMGTITYNKNHHPTVKPIKLMEYLIRLVTPKEGIVLEPFAGSGTTLIACKQQGFNYIGIEREQEYCNIAEARLKAVKVQGEIF